MFTRPIAHGRRAGSSHPSGAAAPKSELWAAVALQQHLVRGMLAEGRLPPALAANAPRLLPEGRLSLAQRMGLAPAPPAPPTSAEWATAEAQSLLRGDVSRPCPICCCSFFPAGGHTGNNEREVEATVLSCSHTFHAACLRQLESFARRAGQPRCCPLCRRASYARRPHSLAPAAIQELAAARIQAIFRGLAARRLFLHMRMRAFPEFRSDAFYTRLRRLNAARLTLHAIHRDEVDAALEQIELTTQRAKAMAMSVSDWLRVLAIAIARTPTAVACAAPTALVSGCGSECPVCLAHVALPPSADAPVEILPLDPSPSPASREELVLALAGAPSGAAGAAMVTAAGPQVAAPTMLLRDKRNNSAAVPRRGGAPPAHHGVMQQPVPRQLGKAVPRALSHAGMGPAPARVPVVGAAAAAVSREQPPPAPLDPQTTVLTSCGHTLHLACLAALERHTGGAGASASCARCPMCRSAYVARRIMWTKADEQRPSVSA